MGEFVEFAEFSRLDLRIGRVEKAEPVSGTDKLLRLEVDVGGERRQLIAGIAEYYNPSELVGREIVVVANLKPKKIRGLWSQGMLLAADVGGRPILLRPDSEVPPGSPVR